MNRLRARFRALNPLYVDIAIAVLFAAAITIEILTTDGHGDSRGFTAALGVLLVAPLALRRVRPELAAFSFAAILVAAGVIGHNFLFENTNGPFIAVLFTLYSIGRHCSPRRFWHVLLPVYAATLVALLTSNTELDSGTVVWSILMFGAPVVAGRALRSRVLLQRELREKADRAEAERALRARRAIENERDRIAGELQAVVANGVNAMVIQAEAVPRLIAAEDTPAAGQALGAIEETGRDALAEMRRLLGVLRRDDDGGLALAPQPGLARLRALVERQRDHGLDVQLEIEGAERPLSTGVDLTAYRVVEDALQAASRQRAEHARVLVRYRDGDLQLEVRDDRSGGASSRLPGLRDRVGLYGGHLTAKREDGAGFTLRARLPIGEGVR